MKNFKDHMFIIMQVGNFITSQFHGKMLVSPNVSIWVPGINFAVLVRLFFPSVFANRYISC